MPSSMGIFLTQGSNSFVSPASQADSLPLGHLGSPYIIQILSNNCSAVCGSCARQLYGVANDDLLQEGLCHRLCYEVAAPRPLPLRQATAVSSLHRRLKHRSGSVSVGSLGLGVYKVLFEPSEHLWRVRGLILNMILPLLPSCWGFSFAFRHCISFFGGIQHSPVDGCSAVSCNFGVLAGDERLSYYSTIKGK